MVYEKMVTPYMYVYTYMNGPNYVYTQSYNNFWVLGL